MIMLFTEEKMLNSLHYLQLWTKEKQKKTRWVNSRENLKNNLIIQKFVGSQCIEY